VEAGRRELVSGGYGGGKMNCARLDRAQCGGGGGFGVPCRGGEGGPGTAWREGGRGVWPVAGPGCGGVRSSSVGAGERREHGGVRYGEMAGGLARG
jgi:hypothetical protein